MAESWVQDNRERIRQAVERGIKRGLLDIADRIAFLAWQNAGSFTNSGDLQRSISTATNQGAAYNLEITRVKADGTEQKERTGERVEVPVIIPKRTDKGFSIEFGCYVPYAAAVEFGSNPHVIEPDPERTYVAGKLRTNPSLRFTLGDGKQEVFAKRVMHPGTEPQPFMRPAIEQVRKEAKAIMARAIREELKKSVPRRS
jgi:HK97 gp10 family phage protein